MSKVHKVSVSVSGDNRAPSTRGVARMNRLGRAS